MTNYHKVIMNGEIFFRGFDESTGFYEDEMLTQEELIEQLMDEFVTSTIEVDQQAIDRAISYIPSSFQREMVQNYINYLEALVES